MTSTEKRRDTATDGPINRIAGHLAERPRNTVTANLNERIVELLAAGHTVTETAALVGRSTSAIYKRLRDKVFMSRVVEARGARLRPLADTAHREAPAALNRLVELSLDPAVHPSTRVKANALLVEMSLRLEGATNVLPRLAAVEAALTGVIGQQGHMTRHPQPYVEMQQAEEVVLDGIDAEETDR